MTVSPLLFWPAWFAGAALLATLVTARLAVWADRFGVVDRPGSRSSHTRVTPRGGGVAIVVVTAGAAVLDGLLHPEAAARLAGMLLPASLVAIVSWIDDVRSLPNRVRFTVHLVAAAAAVAVLGPIRSVDAGSCGSLDLGGAAWPLTMLWIVGLTNAFNFMDGIDGIAGITATAAGAVLAVAAWSLGDPPIAVAAIAFAGAVAGFLVHNWHPAKIFMGDVGSAFCGFVIAVLPLGMPGESVPRIMPVAVLAMWPFIFDASFTLARRLLRGENIFQAHRSHLYQRLVVAGWSHRMTSLLYGSLAALSAAVAISPLLHPGLRLAAEPAAFAVVATSALVLPGLAILTERCRPSTPTS